MLKIFIINYLMYYACCSTLQDILQQTDEFFDELDDSEDNADKIEAFVMMMRRSYDLPPETHKIRKRSLDGKSKLTRDKQGVYLLKSIDEDATVPAKFPNDIVLSYHENGVYAITLENSGKQRTKLADELVVYKYIGQKNFQTIARVPISEARKLSVENVKGSMFITSDENNPDKNANPFQGSKLYMMTPFENEIEFKEVQILDVIHQQDVKFWQYLDQLYLFIAAEGATNNTSNLLIFKWLGRHFDRIQKIPTNSISSLTVFTIGSSMYLASADSKDIHENTDIDSKIFKFHLQDNKFKQYQTIPTHGAKDVKHFSFKDPESMEEEHFIIYANYFSKNEDGNKEYETKSVVYKYDGGYFVPFQSFNLYGAKQWIPIIGSDNEFLLMAVCTYGIVGYQYDGWRFAEIPLALPGNHLERNIQSIRTYEFSKNILLTVADKNSDGTNPNIWLLSFVKKNEVDEQYTEIQEWCENMHLKLSEINFEDAFDEIGNVTDDGFNFKVPVRFKDVDVENIETEDFRGMEENLIDDVNELKNELSGLRIMLDKVEDTMKNVQNGFNYQNIIGPLNMPKLDINCSLPESCFFKNLYVKKLNGEDWELFKGNVIPLDEDIEIDPKIEFENVIVKNSFIPKYLNDHPVETLQDANKDNLINGELVVNGTVIIHGELVLNGYLDEVLIDKENVLLKKGLQNFSSKLSVLSAEIKNLELNGKVNGHLLDDLLKNSVVELEDTYDELNVNNLSVEGLVSGYNLNNLKNALQKIGNQTIEGELFLANVTADEVQLKSNIISGTNISDLIDISKNGSCFTKAKLIFEQDELKVNNLNVAKINSVPVQDYFSQGRNAMRKKFPDIIIFEGNVTAYDIEDPSGNFSLLNIFKNGLRLDEEVINSQFNFTNLKVNNLIVEKINNVSVNSWVFENVTEPLNIKGQKVFSGGVEILNKSYVDSINGIKVKELEQEALRLKESGEINSNFTFESITCKNITAKSIHLGGKNLSNVVSLPLRVIINGSLIADKLDTEELNVTGTIDDISWNEMLEDSIFKDNDTEYIITGEKIINGRLRANNFNLSGYLNDLTFDEFFELRPSDPIEIIIPKNVSMNTTLRMDNLIFQGMLDFIKSENFGSEWLLKDGDQIINSPLTFQNVILNSGCTLKNKIINRINITDLIQNTLRLDENATVKSLQAMKIIAKNVIINGKVNGARFRDAVVQSKSDIPQVIDGHWLFNHDLIINGSLIVEDFVSGLNVSYLCSLKMDNEDEINVIVGGSVKFEHEPEIQETLNGINIPDLMNKIWFKDEDTTLTGKVSFTNITTHNTTQLKGYLNNVNLTHLSKNYINKKTTKIIPANLEFKFIEIKETARIRNSTVGGKVNGIELEIFSKNILLQDIDQVVAGRIHFHNISIGNLNLNGTVNKLDLNKDVLRYDVENAVMTGEKIFENLRVQEIKMKKGKSVQGVVVSDWAKNAVMVNDNVTIEGNIIFAGSEINMPNLKVTGNVNGLKFDRDHILTVNGDQVITGKKYFDLSEYPNNTIKFNSLNVSGLIDGIDFKDLVNNQAYKSKDLIFTKPVNFTNGMIANELTVKGLFQGVNITEISEEISKPIDTSEIDYKFEHLINESLKIKELLDDTPYFLDHYELVQTVTPDVVALLPFSFDEDGELLLSAFTNDSHMEVLKWEPFSQMFVPRDDVRREVNMTFVAPEINGDKFNFYLETKNKTVLLEGGSMIEIQTNNTSTITSFDIRSLNKSCIFVGRKWGNSKIFCNSSLINDLHTYQELETDGAIAASALNINDDIYIAVINKEKLHKDKTENILLVYQFDQKLQQFQKIQTLPEIHPIAVSTIVFEEHYYLVSAGGHLPESVQNSVLTIFRFNDAEGVFIRYHSILVDSLVDAKFFVLPSSELVLYVLTSNPAKPFIVYSYKGIRGFVEETSGLALYRGSKLYPITDYNDQHFLIISGYSKEREGSRGQILKAGFKGSKNRKNLV